MERTNATEGTPLFSGDPTLEALLADDQADQPYQLGDGALFLGSLFDGSSPDGDGSLPDGDGSLPDGDGSLPDGVFGSDTNFVADSDPLFGLDESDLESDIDGLAKGNQTDTQAPVPAPPTGLAPPPPSNQPLLMPESAAQAAPQSKKRKCDEDVPLWEESVPAPSIDLAPNQPHGATRRMTAADWKAIGDLPISIAPLWRLAQGNKKSKTLGIQEIYISAKSFNEADQLLKESSLEDAERKKMKTHFQYYAKKGIITGAGADQYLRITGNTVKPAAKKAGTDGYIANMRKGK